MRFTAKTIAEAEQRLPVLVKQHLGQGAFTSGTPQALEPGRRLVEISVSVPEVARDPRTEEGTLAFLLHRGVGYAEITRAKGEVAIILPSRTEVEKNLLRERESLLMRAEMAFLDSAQEKLAKSPLIQNALNPIKEILVTVADLERVPAKSLREQSRYLPFLQGLRYVELEDGEVYPGPMLRQFAPNAEAQFIYEKILGDIIRKGYEDLSGRLRIRHVTSLVRAANAYFWPSHEVGRRLEYRVEDFGLSTRRLYPDYRPKDVKLRNHVDELTRVKVFERRGPYRTAAEETWQHFEEKAPALTA